MSTGRTPREVALEALVRVEQDAAWANRLLGPILDRSGLEERDRRFVTALVYGTTRMRRACDWLVDRFLTADPDLRTRAVLRLGAYQLAFLGLPPHAAVGESVGLASRRTRGLVNAVLRRVSEAEPAWPSDAVRLSYPDWIVERLRADLGEPDAMAALEAMNEAPTADARPDGYVQDRASRWVAEALGARPGERVADLCAAPGGKATALAASGAAVLALDRRASGARALVRNADRLGLRVPVAVADARRAPLRPGVWDRVLVDAPCSGLGVLHRRPDARWRTDEPAIARLADLQRELVEAAVSLVRPGGVLLYSVCTLTRAETVDVAEAVEGARPELVALSAPGPPWRPHGTGALVLPQDAGTDGMALFSWRRER